MSYAVSDPVQGMPSADSVEALMRECESLSRALSQARLIRRFLLLGLLTLAIAASLSFYRFYTNLTSRENLDQMVGTVQKRLGERSDSYMTQVQTLVNSSSPVVSDVFYKQATKDLPLLLQGVEKERDAFVENLKARLARTLSEHYDGIVTQHTAILVKELPEAQDEQVRRRLVASLHIVFERMVKKYYADELNARLIAIYDAWDHFPAAAKPGKDEPSLDQQFIGVLLEAVSHRMAETSPKVTSSNSL